MLEKVNAPKLVAFYKCLFVADLTTKLVLSSKGTSTKVRAGDTDKKGGPLLIQLTFDAKTTTCYCCCPYFTWNRGSNNVYQTINGDYLWAK